MGLKVLALAALLSIMAVVQTNATGFDWFDRDWSIDWSELKWDPENGLINEDCDWEFEWDCDWDWDCERPPQSVPEPGAALASIMAAAGLGFMLRRRK
jgi:hypothetical protein